MKIELTLFAWRWLLAPMDVAEVPNNMLTVIDRPMEAGDPRP
jgi:hypothetical protein